MVAHIQIQVDTLDARQFTQNELCIINDALNKAYRYIVAGRVVGYISTAMVIKDKTITYNEIQNRE